MSSRKKNDPSGIETAGANLSTKIPISFRKWGLLLFISLSYLPLFS